MKTTKVRPISGVAIVIVSIFALGACGGSGGSNDSSADSGSVESLADSSAGKAAPEVAPEDADGAAPKQAVTQASIISTGSVALSAKDVGRTRTQVQHICDTYAGQVTEQETSDSDDSGPEEGLSHARMVLRIPSKSFGDAMADLEDTAGLVDSSTTTTDVTTQVVDTEVRVKNARTSIERIRTLLSRAEAIGDVIAIESELARREADLNSLLAQQAALEDQTSLSTITVSIDRARSGGTSGDDPGFLAGLSAGWQALGDSARVLAVALGAVIPWTPVLLLLAAPFWLLARRRRQVVAPVPATGPAEE